MPPRPESGYASGLQPGHSPGLQPGYAPPPHAPRRRTGLIIGSVVAVVAVIAALFVGATVLRQPDSQTASSTNAATATPTTPARPSTTERTSPSTTEAPSTGNGPGGSSGTPSAPVDEAQVKAEIDTLQRFVEKQRGLTFKNDVEVKVLAGAEFKTRVLKEFEAEESSMQQQGELLKAVGLVPVDLDVVKAQRGLLGDGVLGFYDPKTKALVVRGDNIGPFFREIAVHELTHALDDQYFALDRPDLTAKKDGSDWAFLGLVEGNARRVEYAYKDQLSAQDKQTLSEEQLKLGMDQMGSVMNTPMILPRILMAPYDYGNPFVKALVARRGNAGVDKAYANPPLSSEQILDEAKFESGEGPVAVDRPPADGEIVSEGTLGELMTGFMLNGGGGGLGLDGLGGGGGLDALGGMDEKAITDLINKILGGEIDPSVLGGAGPGGPGALPGEGGTNGTGLDAILGGNADGPGGQFGAVKTVKGWGGDHYVLYRSTGNGVCIRADWKMDTAAALTDMEAALRNWSTTSKATIDKPTTDTVRMTRCSGVPAGGGSGSPASPPSTTSTTTTTTPR